MQPRVSAALTVDYPVVYLLRCTQTGLTNLALNKITRKWNKVNHAFVDFDTSEIMLQIILNNVPFISLKMPLETMAPNRSFLLLLVIAFTLLATTWSNKPIR